MLPKTNSSPQPGNHKKIEASPFLRWAGGKRAVAAEISNHFPDSFEVYLEPFVGAGSLLFRTPDSISKTISDFNEELIVTYLALQNNVEQVLEELAVHNVSKEHYLKVREWDRDPDFKLQKSNIQRAARFIYLNKCGFNGLYRVNSKGHYNIPYGNPKANLDIFSESNLRSVSDFLNGNSKEESKKVTILQGEYHSVLKSVFSQIELSKSEYSKHFVYLDPPYDVEPESDVPGFVSYNENGFGVVQQIELAETVKWLTSLGVPVLMSNTKTKNIQELYPNSEFGYTDLQVRRSISAKSSSRGTITEVLIDNYESVGITRKLSKEFPKS